MLLIKAGKSKNLQENIDNRKRKMMMKMLVGGGQGAPKNMNLKSLETNQREGIKMFVYIIYDTL